MGPRAAARLGVCLVALLLATAASAGPPPSSAPPSAAPDTYVLGPGDQIEVTVYGEPDLTRTVTIKPDGVIALPLINQVKAAGKTAAQLEADLTRLYARYLKSPSVSVLVRQFQPDHVYVMGEVAKPGRYDLTNGMTLLDALTLAGGGTDHANLGGVQVVRHVNGKSTSIPVKADQLLQGKNNAPNLPLENNDLVYVPRRGLTLLDILHEIGILRGVLGI
jgi:polysaccharide export outer membrane protein